MISVIKTVFNFQGYLTLQGWMCRWTLMTLLDLQNTSAYLAYLGFNFLENESQKAAIHSKCFILFTNVHSEIV